MIKSLPLVFFGNDRLSTGFKPKGAPTLESLLAEGYNIVAVVANYEVGISRNARQLEIEVTARNHCIPILLPKKLSDIHDYLVDLQPTAGILAAYGRLIPQSIIDIFPYGILNIHPSLLPLYRGPTPIEQVILDNAPTTGVSIMQLTKAMDAGPIYKQAAIKLQGTEEKFALTQQLLDLGGKLLREVLPYALNGTLKPQPQNESQATYCRLIQKTDGILDWSKPAERLAREVRAYASWPKSRTELFGHSIIVTKARVVQDKTDGELTLACNPGWLAIEELIAPSGRRMNGADFLRGYKK